ncbi:UNVERIFIED_CONTAM: hypothetical protein Sangu_2529700 [Sesamum angustifolium]|uniref:Uncharacterized protein n=1 Tax=Sesamum angustifolium TaxID=2727405 RepID=A0AAW2JDV5_9LAMI
MVFYAVGPSYFASSNEGVPDDGKKSCPVDASTSSYAYGGSGPYYYDESGLANRFSNIVHAAYQPSWDGCSQSELVLLLSWWKSRWMVIFLSEYMIEYPNGLIEYCPMIHSARSYYSTKKLVKNLGLPVEKIHVCKNGCMLYWKDDVDLEHCKFYGDGRYNPAQGRDSHQKKYPYVVFRYLPLTPHLQRLYSLRATAEHTTWHAIHQTAEGICV